MKIEDVRVGMKVRVRVDVELGRSKSMDAILAAIHGCEGVVIGVDDNGRVIVALEHEGKPALLRYGPWKLIPEILEPVENERR